MMLLWLAACGPDGVEGWFVVLHGAVVGEEGERLVGAEVTLAAADGTQIGTVTTDADGDWSLPVYGTTLLGNDVVALAHAEGYAEGRATFEVNLVSPQSHLLRAGPMQEWQATERRLPALRLALDAPVATVTGRLFDATTGAAVDGVSLILQHGWNAPVGEAALDQAVTADDGAFRLEANVPGLYTVYAAGDDSWASTRFPAFLTGGGGTVVGLVSTPIEVDQARAAVRWGEAPFDLDLHLSAPLAGGAAGEDGTGQYHVWAGDPAHPVRATDEDYVARMERTDDDGRGPETVFVRSLSDRGELRLSVFDNDNRSDAENLELAGSGATLQVWFGEDYPRYHSVSPGVVATLWRPVAIDVADATTYAVEQYVVGVAPSDASAF